MGSSVNVRWFGILKGRIVWIIIWRFGISARIITAGDHIPHRLSIPPDPVAVVVMLEDIPANVSNKTP